MNDQHTVSTKYRTCHKLLPTEEIFDRQELLPVNNTLYVFEKIICPCGVTWYFPPVVVPSSSRRRPHPLIRHLNIRDLGLFFSGALTLVFLGVFCSPKAWSPYGG